MYIRYLLLGRSQAAVEDGVHVSGRLSQQGAYDLHRKVQLRTRRRDGQRTDQMEVRFSFRQVSGQHPHRQRKRCAGL